MEVDRPFGELAPAYESGLPPPRAGAMARLQGGVAGLAGWRRAALALALGAVAAAGLPPLYLLPLLFPAMVGLMWLIESAPRARGAFWSGWWFGLGHFAAGMYWIGVAFLVDAEKFGWMAPFAVLGLSALLAVFPALVALATGASSARGAGRVLVFGASWTAFEWVRSWIFTGLPWNLTGTGWVFSDAMIQLAALGGVYGLSLITVIAAAMPAVLAGQAVGARRETFAVAASLAVLAVAWGGGELRLRGALDGAVPGVRLRLVQPNIPQKLKWRPELRERHVARQLRMSAPGDSADGPPTHVIWAETAVPFFLAGNPRLLAMVGEAAPPDGLMIVGAPRRSRPSSGPFRVWNSLHAVDSGGAVVATFDKFHLVPFGEYVPFRAVLGMAKITTGRSDFSSGPGPRTLRLKGLPPVGPLICFETVFPGRVVDPDDRPDWLLNITNDGWFGISSGPYQHFAAARLRAVEEGLPLVRVANTGISAVIDAYGRVKARLGLDRAGVLDAKLPPPVDGLTPYARFGNLIIFAVLVAVALAGTLLAPRRRPPRH